MIPVVVGICGLVIGTFLNVIIIESRYAGPSSGRHRAVFTVGHALTGLITFRCSPTCSYTWLSGVWGTYLAAVFPARGASWVLFAIAAYEFGISLVLVWALGF